MSAGRLGLGTVQFAFDYGATNQRGRVGDDEARHILRMAAAQGMGVVHTSSTYGDCEALLGREAQTIASMLTALKLPSIRAAVIGATETASLAQSLARSLVRLRRDRIDFVLFHDARELRLRGADRALDMLREAQARGEIGRIGVTAYNPPELWEALELFRPEAVQIPLNLLDQRFAKSGLLGVLKESGAVIHARSVFLQGTLLVEPDRLPATLNWARAAFTTASQFIAAHDLGRLRACLAYGLSIREVDSLVLGVAGADELAAILDAAKDLPAALPDFTCLSVDDERIVNPTLWQAAGRPTLNPVALPSQSQER